MNRKEFSFNQFVFEIYEYTQKTQKINTNLVRVLQGDH